MDKLADALIPRPAPVLAPAVDHAVMVEHHVMGRWVSMEMDHVMNDHCGYLHDLDRRDCENAKIFKCVMKGLSNNHKKKAKKMKSVKGEKIMAIVTLTRTAAAAAAAEAMRSKIVMFFGSHALCYIETVNLGPAFSTSDAEDATRHGWCERSMIMFIYSTATM
jgi:hypothetical protein